MDKKKKFIIPSADEVESFEKRKPKVKSYFKPSKNHEEDVLKIKKGVQNCATSSNSNSDSNARKQINLIPSDKSVTTKVKQFDTKVTNPGSVPAYSTVSTADFYELRKPTTNQTGESSSINRVNKESVSLGTSKTERDITSLKLKPTGNKIGSGFASTFAALKDCADYEEPKIPDRPAEKSANIPIVVNNKPASSSCLIVNPKQRGNPILKHVRNVPYEYKDITPDYVMGKTSCALFLSLRYHLLNPNYIHKRLKSLANMFELRLLLVQVDVKDPQHSLKELAKMAILADCTLLLAWSAEEAGRYLETYKSYENKSADMLKERVDTDFVSRMTDCLTTIKSVNKTDVITLLSTFGSFDGIVRASEDELAFCPGFGPNKAKRLADALKEPFIRSKRSKLSNTSQHQPGPSTS